MLKENRRLTPEEKEEQRRLGKEIRAQELDPEPMGQLNEESIHLSQVKVVCDSMLQV